jgi:3D (Asp-Asp-Asp) domain-containing protein
MTGDRKDTPTVRDLVRATVRGLADLVSRIVKGIAGLVPVVALGCNGPKVDQGEQQAAVSLERPRRVELTEEPRPLGRFDITFYYVVGEDEVAKLAAKKAANDNHGSDAGAGTDLAAISPELVTLYEPKACKPIAEVSREFAAQLQLQGTGKLRDGRVLNIWGACPCERKPCFKVTENQWGTAGTGKPLEPFRTVAVDRNVVKLGSLLYVPLLEGRTMPGRPPWGGFVHDGCLVADDTGGGIDGKQLDLFVGRRGYYLGLSGIPGGHSWARHVPVYDGSKICERKGRKVARKTGSI